MQLAIHSAKVNCLFLYITKDGTRATEMAKQQHHIHFRSILYTHEVSAEQVLIKIILNYTEQITHFVY